MGGTTAKTALLPGGTPFLEPAWKAAMIRTEASREQIRRAETALQSKAAPLLTVREL